MSCIPGENKSHSQIDDWIVQQIDIAAKVVIIPDELDFSVQKEKLTENNRFKPWQFKDSLSYSDDSVYFGGVDVSFPDDDNEQAVAVYVIVDIRTMSVVYESHAFFTLTIPYIPSFLAFREIEPLDQLVRNQVLQQPDLTPRAILVDGNGILHSRGAGIACFLGVRTKIPTIGVGKSLFCAGGLTKNFVADMLTQSARDASTFLRSNNVLSPEERERNDNYILIDQWAAQNENATIMNSHHESTYRSVDSMDLNELSKHCHGLMLPLREQNASGGRILGAALVAHGGNLQRDKQRRLGSKNPIFISVGHNISLIKATVIACSLSLARIPEPVRQADLIGRRLLREAAKAKNPNCQSLSQG
jgi:deoxyinosine 3'endonuclease (endonuclease V)